MVDYRVTLSKEHVARMLHRDTLYVVPASALDQVRVVWVHVNETVYEEVPDSC